MNLGSLTQTCMKGESWEILSCNSLTVARTLPQDSGEQWSKYITLHLQTSKDKSKDLNLKLSK